MDWDPSEYNETPEQIVQARQEAAQQAEETAGDIIQQLQSPGSVAAEENYMGDVDMRLEVASFYRVLLRGGLFDNQGQSASIVENEIRVFVKDRLETLLNIKATKAEPQQSQFSEDEVSALKVLAKMALKQYGNDKPPAPEAPKVPTVKRKPAPEAPPIPSLKKTPSPTVQAQPSPVTAVQAPVAAPPPATIAKQRRGPRKGDGQVVGSGVLPFPTNMSIATAQSASAGRDAGINNPDIAKIITKTGV